MEIELKIVLSVLIPLTIGLYVFGLWYIRESTKSRLIGWTIARISVPKEDKNGK